ncbi:phosphoglycerate mutase [Nitrospira sp. KM1]|uniref:phosphoglycerate mutase n=1 Tax=Nitrospira sp. KM1 TaxID=1936990 RepID=UPI0015642F0B|nr:phosphoglycerate mutase [Nitrospira sp. KM1]
MKYVILHAGGMADAPRQELAGATPLQAASTPNLDRITQTGELGLLMLPESSRYGSGWTGTAILGYEPKKHYQGPGPLEAVSLGVAVGEHDVVYRCTMVTLKGEPHSSSKTGNEFKKLGPQLVMDDATAGLITTAEARELIDAVNEQLGSEVIQFYPGSGHRHLMVWVNGKPRAVCMDPQSLVGRPLGDALPSGDGADMLRKLMDASLLILRGHPLNDERIEAGNKPANCLWLWGEGRAVVWPSLTERFRVSGAVVSSSDVHRGLGMMAGLGNGTDGENLAAADWRTQARRALEQLRAKDFAYIHLELPDEVVYGTEVKAKLRAIEDIDREYIGPFVEGLNALGPYRLLIVCDPGTAQDKVLPGQWFYAYYDSSQKSESPTKRRFTEADAQSSPLPQRDATKFVVRLFSKSA